MTTKMDKKHSGNFLGQENVNRLKGKEEFNFKKQLNTQFGQIELKITYRAQYFDLYISLPDTQTTGLSMKIELDEQFNPKCFVLIDDNNSYFATLFAESGLKQFSQHLGTPNPETFKKTLQAQENYIKTTAMLLPPQLLKEIGFDFFFFYKEGAVWLSPAS